MKIAVIAISMKVTSLMRIDSQYVVNRSMCRVKQFLVPQKNLYSKTTLDKASKIHTKYTNVAQKTKYLESWVRFVKICMKSA